MSKINTQTIRINDKLMLQVFLEIDFHDRYDVCTIEFRGKSGLAHITSTSEGYISKEIVRAHKNLGRVNFTLYYPQEDIDCLISYLREDELIHYESLPIDIQPRKQISHSESETRSIEMLNASFKKRMYEFERMLERRKSSWRLRLTAQENIQVDIITSGPQKILIAFGPNVIQPGVADFIFPLEPDTKTLIIPKQIFWKKYDKYPIEVKLCCSELVRAGFHTIDHIFYKMCVSNMLNLSDLPRGERVSLDAFITPTGLPLDGQSWKIKQGLPIYTGM